MISRGLSSSWPVSTHQVGCPCAASRRQPGSAAKWEEPIPVSTIRSYRPWRSLVTFGSSGPAGEGAQGFGLVGHVAFERE